MSAEVVYKCNSCNRSVRIPSDKAGVDVVDGCIVTHGCSGSLSLVSNIRDRSSTPAFPEDVRGLNNWVQRKIIHDHIQPSRSNNWLIRHELASDPLFYVYERITAVASDTRPRPSNEGTFWFKTANALDPNYPTDPAVFGLYTLTDGVWVKVWDHINGSLLNDSTYQCDTPIEPTSIIPLDENTTRLLFDRKISGVVQAVAAASKQNYQKVSSRLRSVAAETRTSSNNGEMVIAIAGDPTTPTTSTVTLLMYGPTANLSTTVSYGNGVNDPSANSAWFGVRGVYINGVAHRLASISVPKLFPTSVMLEHGIEPELAYFSISASNSRAYIIHSNHPHGPTDRVYNTATPFLSVSDSDVMYLSNGEVVIPSSASHTVYPPIAVIK